MGNWNLDIPWTLIEPDDPSGADMVDVTAVRRKWLDVPYDLQSPSQVLDIYLPAEGDGPFPTYIFVHGGAFVAGDKQDVQFLLAADGIIASLRSSLDPQTDRIRRLEKARLLLFYMRRDTMEYAGKGRFIGFPQNSTPEFLRESLTDKDPDGQRITVSGQTIVTCELDEPDRADGPDGRIYSPALRRLPRVISGEYYADYNQMNGTENGPLTLEYAFDSRLVIEKIDFEKLSPVYTEQSGKSPDFSKVPMFNGNIYFYNYDTGKNDLMETKDSYTAEELAPYLSPANTLMIRYSGGNEGLQYLPVPCAVGKRAEKQE